MIFPSEQIFFAKETSLEQIYQLFETMQTISSLKFCGFDVDSFCHLSQEIFNFIESKHYHIIGIYLAESRFPTVEIHQPLFDSDEFQTVFKACLKHHYPHLTYFRLNTGIDFYQLIEVDSDGKTGKTFNI